MTDGFRELGDDDLAKAIYVALHCIGTSDGYAGTARQVADAIRGFPEADTLVRMREAERQFNSLHVMYMALKAEHDAYVARQTGVFPRTVRRPPVGFRYND